jgi:hypothetical protein
MWLPATAMREPEGSTRSSIRLPTSGPSTPMCCWPARLVAAIFQPTIGC